MVLVPWHVFVLLFWRIPGRLFLSARAWVLFLFLLIVLLIAYSSFSNIYTPFTTDAYVQAYVVQVAPQVEGQVVRVYVRENQLVDRGDLLFEIDPRPFEHKIARLEAKLVQAENHVEQLHTEVAANKAEEARVKADDDYARAVYRQEEEIFKQQSTTERRYLEAVQKRQASIALLERTQALLRKSHQALDARVGKEHALVAEVKAQLAEARLNLEWTKVKAPARGWLTNLQLREGAYARVGQSVLTCIEADSWWVVANYRENSLERIEPDMPAELTFTSVPGRIYAGKVEVVGLGVSEGQGVPSGDLPTVKNPPAWLRGSQRFQVRLSADVPPGQSPLRVGTTVSVTIYTSPDYALNPLARFWQRVVTVFNYLY
jgi:multidrug resistance efflux pump